MMITMTNRIIHDGEYRDEHDDKRNNEVIRRMLLLWWSCRCSKQHAYLWLHQCVTWGKLCLHIESRIDLWQHVVVVRRVQVHDRTRRQRHDSQRWIRKLMLCGGPVHAQSIHYCWITKANQQRIRQYLTITTLKYITNLIDTTHIMMFSTIFKFIHYHPAHHRDRRQYIMVIYLFSAPDQLMSWLLTMLLSTWAEAPCYDLSIYKPLGQPEHDTWCWKA